MSMSKVNGNSPAFPFEERNDDGSHYHSDPGMTIRQHYAGLALPWALAEAMTMRTKEASPCPTAARLALDAADALIAELEKGGDA